MADQTRQSNPRVIVIAGPNGAGKTTAAPTLLKDIAHVTEFVNADMIAQGLSAFDPQESALAAGRIMLARLRELASRQRDFAFETTLAAKSFSPWLRQLQQVGYEFVLHFLWLDSPELAIERVAARVRAGGHSIPIDVIRRRYERGLVNFKSLYAPLADVWFLYHNASDEGLKVVATGGRTCSTVVKDDGRWHDFNEDQ